MKNLLHTHISLFAYNFYNFWGGVFCFIEKKNPTTLFHYDYQLQYITFKEKV